MKVLSTHRRIRHDVSQENPNQTQDLDATIDTGGVSAVKERTIEKDQKDYLFPETKMFHQIREKGKHKLFEEEEITYGVYEINKCTFNNNRPVEWANSLGYFIASENCECKWTYQKVRDCNLSSAMLQRVAHGSFRTN